MTYPSSRGDVLAEGTVSHHGDVGLQTTHCALRLEVDNLTTGHMFKVLHVYSEKVKHDCFMFYERIANTLTVFLVTHFVFGMASQLTGEKSWIENFSSNG